MRSRSARSERNCTSGCETWRDISPLSALAWIAQSNPTTKQSDHSKLGCWSPRENLRNWAPWWRKIFLNWNPLKPVRGRYRSTGTKKKPCRKPAKMANRRPYVNPLPELRSLQQTSCQRIFTETSSKVSKISAEGSQPQVDTEFHRNIQKAVVRVRKSIYNFGSSVWAAEVRLSTWGILMAAKLLTDRVQDGELFRPS